MGFIVNAWLERANPYIQVLSGHSGDILLSLDSTAVTNLLEQGDITINELKQNNSLILALCLYSSLFVQDGLQAG